MKHEIKNGYIEIEQDELEENELVITMVYANEKRKGTGTELVKWAIEYAREQGKELTLCACPQDDSIELDDLIEFYAGLGFNEEYRQSDCALMRY